jgi:Ca2+-transporting ATPase
MRDTHKSFFAMHHLENKLMLLACVVGFALQWSVTEIPFLVRAFGTASLSLKEWQILVGLAAMPLVAHEVLVLAGKVRKRR